MSLLARRNLFHDRIRFAVTLTGIVSYFDTGRMFSERKFYEVLSTPGVQQAEKYMQNFANWKKSPPPWWRRWRGRRGEWRPGGS